MTASVEDLRRSEVEASIRSEMVAAVRGARQQYFEAKATVGLAQRELTKAEVVLCAWEELASGWGIAINDKGAEARAYEPGSVTGTVAAMRGAFIH